MTKSKTLKITQTRSQSGQSERHRGTLRALGLGALAALAFASIGFIVSATVTTSERITEFAILRALGLSARELSAWVSLENAFLPVFGLVNFEDRAKVGMVQFGGGLGLANKARTRLGLLRQLRGEEFESYGSLKLQVLRFVNNSHPAPGYLPENPVLGAQDGPRRQLASGSLKRRVKRSRGFI